MTYEATARAAVEPFAPCAPTDAAAFVAHALERSRGAVAHITVPAPVAPPETLLAIAPSEPAVLWCPPAGPAVAGIGEAIRLGVDDLRGDAAALWRRTAELTFPGCTAMPPRLFGGIAFAPGAASAPPWTRFGDGRFSLPRWRYVVDGDRAWLTLAGVRPPASAAAETANLLRALANPPRRTPTAPRVDQIAEQAFADWADQIDEIRAAIRSGRFDKIVAARRSVVELSDRIDEVSVLARLGDRYPDCFRYAVRLGDAAFVGATPERLVAKRDGHIQTQALAGSIDRDSAPNAGDTLRASKKDLAEHGYVVRAILDQLAPFCTDLTAPEEPEICTLRHLLHLRTPITGRLLGRAHVLDLVDALHPTPAVGGVPTADAVQWIGDNEPAPRGWYAGPIGWFDAAGDGEFAVALRSGLLVGSRAYLYAGAGIVTGSDAAAEYAETDLKQRALLGALGVGR